MPLEPQGKLGYFPVMEEEEQKKGDGGERDVDKQGLACVAAFWCFGVTLQCESWVVCPQRYFTLSPMTLWNSSDFSDF